MRARVAIEAGGAATIEASKQAIEEARGFDTRTDAAKRADIAMAGAVPLALDTVARFGGKAINFVRGARGILSEEAEAAR